jgi:membrane associated rhomboid family serine protease
MFLPLGLFLRLKNIPIVTILIIICSFVNHFIFSDLSKAQSEMMVLKEEFQIKKFVMLDKYCLDRGFKSENCNFSSATKVENSKSKKFNKELNIVSTLLESMNHSSDLLAMVSDFDNILEEGLSESSDISDLDGYSAFMISHNHYKENFNKIIHQNNLLNVTNINLSSLLKASITHAGFLHLFGNMLVLFVFGIYVEARIGTLNYFLSYVVTGFVGLSIYSYFIMSSNTFVVGASANVFGMMGMFYIFFKKVNMKFFAFYIYFKVIEIPVKTYFFILFILLELINMFVANNVAHGAHIAGLVTGILIAFAWDVKHKLPEGFLFLSEYEWWKEIKSIPTLNKRILYTQNLLSFNPYNNKVRAQILNSIFEDKNEETSKYESFINKELSPFLLDKYKEGKTEQILKILSSLPRDLCFNSILRLFHQKILLELLDISIKNNQYFLSLRVILCICEKYPKSPQLDNYLKTAASLIETQTISNEKIVFLHERSKSIQFSSFIVNYIELI